LKFIPHRNGLQPPSAIKINVDSGFFSTIAFQRASSKALFAGVRGRADLIQKTKRWTNVPCTPRRLTRCKIRRSVFRKRATRRLIAPPPPPPSNRNVITLRRWEARKSCSSKWRRTLCCGG